MGVYRFETCEFCFPVWGSFAIEMAHEAGFQGLRITDGGGYLQPHPQNNGFVEYERFGLDLRRKDSFPLLDKRVQEDYLQAAEAFGVSLTGIDLYLLKHQGFMKFAPYTPQGEQCRETIRNAVIAAAQLGIPTVSVPAQGLFGVGQNAYALDHLRYAAETAAEHGVRALFSSDGGLQRQMEIYEALEGRAGVDLAAIDPALYGAGGGAEMIRALGGNRLGVLRVRDGLLDSEGFLTQETLLPALLGRGDAGFADWAQAARDAGYDGPIVSETPYYSGDLHREGGDFLSLARADVSTLRRTFGESEEG